MNNADDDKVSEELALFRNQWKAEVQARRAQAAPFKLLSSAATSSPATKDGHIPQIQPSRLVQTVTRDAHALEKRELNALSVYKQAVKAEQEGKIEEALRFYQSAFKAHPDVDALYQREELLSGAAQLAHHVPHHPHPHHPQPTSPVKEKKQPLLPAISLPTVIDGFHDETSEFVQEDEEEPVYLEHVPGEILLHILRFLDITSLERFALVSRKARIVTLDSDIWREWVTITYRPPQINSIDDIVPIVKRCKADYRRIFMEQPRVRTDGVYIAVCHYIRPGLSEDHWVNVNHLITYHRYIRFFPNGQVFSLLANEDPGPAHVIPLLRPHLRMKGLFVGTWKLEDRTVYLEDLVDASPPPPTSSHTHGHGRHESSEEPLSKRYTFAMSLNLFSRPLGRWNKMEITGYDSVKVDTGDASPITLKNERPFWFSKVGARIWEA